MRFIWVVWLENLLYQYLFKENNFLIIKILLLMIYVHLMYNFIKLINKVTIIIVLS